MSSAIVCAQYVSGGGSSESGCLGRSVGRRAVLRWWRSAGETAGGLMFLAVLGWETWRIGGQLVQYAARMADAGFGGLV